MPNRAVFIDKDGTLLENVPYNVDPALMRLAPGAPEALRLTHGLGYRLIVVSNQSGVARGYFPESSLIAVEANLRRMFGDLGVPLAGFYYCPHHPQGDVDLYKRDCTCRKPAPGMLLRAAHDHALDLTRSWLVGDILDDIEAGRRAGCATVLVDTGGETEWALSPLRGPHHTVHNLYEAALVIATGDGAPYTNLGQEYRSHGPGLGEADRRLREAEGSHHRGSDAGQLSGRSRQPNQ